ncbi:dihydrofolate reductase [Moraxella oblonga]|uniref:dihydrofolate reductase n=1 Tax=Moraxella oblonga TaxID=200413 RepID=UPI000833F85C
MTQPVLLNNSIKIVHVVAFDQNHCIGKDDTLAWHIPEDLKHFKSITTGGVVVMGKKTFLSMGKPLPNRINWVVTSDKNWRADGVKVAHSLEEAMEQASIDIKKMNQNQLFIIGGGQIYQQTLAIADVLEITRVDLAIDGDAFYPRIDDSFEKVWQSAPQHDDKNGIGFIFERYQRIDKYEKNN